MRTQEKTQSCDWRARLRRDCPLILECIFAFTVVFVIGLCMLWKLEAAPFGTRTLIGMDLADQYFGSFLNQANLKSPSELFYSWDGGLGYNNWAQSAYYCNSIFLLLLRHKSVTDAVVMLHLIMILKPALASVTCLLFLSDKLKSKNPFLCGGAISYALCAWYRAFMLQMMWTDLLILAPLLMMARERMMRKGRGCFYSVLLAICIIANFYISYAVCLFLIFYTLVEETCLFSRNGGKVFARRIGRFLFYSALGGAISAAVTIPTLFALRSVVPQSDAAMTTYSDVLPWLSFLRLLLPGQAVRVWSDGANLATGAVTLGFAIYWFFQGKEDVRSRILHAFLLVFLVISANTRWLIYFWHGFHEPRFLPGRWTFLFSLYLVELYGRGLLSCRIRLREHTWHRARAAQVLSIALLCLLTVGQIAERGYDDIIQEQKDVLDLADMLKFASLGNYDTVVEDYRKATDQTSSREDDFYRTELVPAYTDNASILFHYKGVEYYSSLMQANVYDFFQWLGLTFYTEDISVSSNRSSPVLNALFGIRYLVGFEKDAFEVCPDLTMSGAGQAGNSAYVKLMTSYELPLAFPVSDKTRDLSMNGTDWGLLHQNDLLSALCGKEENVFQAVNCDLIDTYNIMVDDSRGSSGGAFQKIDVEKDAYITWDYDITEDGPLFLETNLYDGTITVYQNGRQMKQVNCVGNEYNYLGNYKNSDTLELVYAPGANVEAGGMSEFGLQLFRMDENALNDAMNILPANDNTSLTVMSFRNDDIISMASAGQDSLYLTSIPQDGGWRVSIDGKKVDTEVLCGALLGFEMPAGNHVVEFSYRVPGMIPGIAISLGGIGLAILIFLAERKKHSVGQRKDREAVQ